MHLGFADHLSQCLFGNISKTKTQLEIETIEVKTSEKDKIIRALIDKDKKLQTRTMVCEDQLAKIKCIYMKGSRAASK